MYFQRDIEQAVLRNIKNDYILLILGSRQTGKTTLLKRVLRLLESKNTCFFINLEDPEYKRLLNAHPKKLYKIIGSAHASKKHIVFIDEVQYLDNPSNFLKFIYDECKGKTKIIATGSSSFYIDKKFKDSLAGRKKLFHLYGLNFREFLTFKKESNFLKILKNHKSIPLVSRDKYEQLLSEYITYGGYPRIALAQDAQEKRDVLEELAFSYTKKDIFEAKIQNEEKYFHLFKILAHQCGQLVNTNELANTLNLSQPTVEKYLYVMQKSFHIALIPPFYSNIRKELSKMKKIYFYDPGIRNQFCGNFKPIEQREDKGQFLENIFFRELLFKEGLESVKYWRTLSKNEVDFIVNEKQAFEIKFNKRQVKKSKYRTFQKRFPDIKLEFMTFNDLERFIA